MIDPPELDELDTTDDTRPRRSSRPHWADDADLPSAGDRWSTFDTLPDAARAPEPWPAWLVTDGDAHDTELGVLKTGKEADVFLLERATSTRSCLLAAKRYRTAEHKQFSRDDGYRAGRGIRKSRERRAVARGTDLGRAIAQAQWALYEWSTLVDMHAAGLPVPYPVSLDGMELLMEFVGSPDGAAAPRLAQTRPTLPELSDLYGQARDVVLSLAGRGLAHGDLSPYNVLLHEGRLVVIDWPQVVDVVANPTGFDYLHRDVTVMCDWFVARGLDVDGEELFAEAVAEVTG